MPKTRQTSQRTARNAKVRHYVREWRDFRGLSQERLADRIDKSRGLIAQIESGLTELTLDNMYALAEALQCEEPWDLLRVNPLKEGQVVDITDALRGADPSVKEKALSFVQGLVAGSKG
jgi:transcriptional regulator with XRE-family HTH domain